MLLRVNFLFVFSAPGTADRTWREPIKACGKSKDRRGKQTDGPAGQPALREGTPGSHPRWLHSLAEPQGGPSAPNTHSAGEAADGKVV